MFKTPKRTFGGRQVISNDLAMTKIEHLILSSEPFLISRFGSTETRALIEYDEINMGKRLDFSNSMLIDINNLCGVFPATHQIVARFVEEMKSVAMDVDVCGVRTQFFEFDFWANEERATKLLRDDSKLVDIEILTPLNFENNWVRLLRGKKVLVIHPFTDSIKKQFAKREKLFKNNEISLDFELITINPIQSLGWQKGRGNIDDWFKALEMTTGEIDRLKEFDIALVGAGAYGMFIGSHIKNMGKQAIHIGGGLQLLFGIKGSRWINDTNTKWLQCLINEEWVWPLEKETPENYLSVEGGAYWDSDINTI
jgi:hypothetical protein